MSESIYKFYDSLSEVKNQYSNNQIIKPEKNKTCFYHDKEYQYHGKAIVDKGMIYKIQLIFKIIASALLVPLTFCLILKVKSFKEQFNHKVTLLSNPTDKVKIYVLKELQKQTSNDSTSRQKEERLPNPSLRTPGDQLNSDFSTEHSSSTTPEPELNPFPKFEWKEFNVGLSRSSSLSPGQEKSEKVALNSSLNLKTEISEEEALSQILEKEDISGCFHQYSIEKYITVCRALVSKYQDPLDPTAERKLRAMMDDLIAKKTIDIWDYKQIEEIYTAIFNACSSVEQMIPMMQYNSGKIYLECPLGVIYEKGWIEEYVQKASLSLVKHYLTPKPILYFALKNAFIAQNKYEQLLEVLTEGQRDSMAIVTENEFKIPDPSRLPVELHTKVTDAHGNPIHVSIYDMHKKREFYPLYQLRTDEGKVLGDISLKPYSKNYITINAMQSFYKDTREYRGVGSALHEFAIQKSFQEGCGGRVQLNAAYNSDLFHFNCGYRYLNPREYTLLRGKISEMIESYLTAKKNNEPYEDLLSSISSYFETKDDMLIQNQLKNLTKVAKKSLKTDPVSIQEIVENGFYYDLNEYSEDIIKKSPLYHPELGPHLKEYQAAKKNNQSVDEMIEKIEALRNQEDPELQKCFNRLRKEAAKELDREPENLQEILDYGIKPPYFFNKGGWMALSDNAIQKWKEILAITE